MNNVFDILGQALIDTSMTVIGFLPKVILAIIIFGLGWVFGSILGRAITSIISMLRIDQALHKAGMDLVSEKAGMRVSVASFFGGVFKWLVIVAFTITSAEILGLNQVTTLLGDLLVYIPQVIVAAIVLVMAALAGDFVSRVVEHSVKATGINAHFVANVARWSIFVVGGVLPALVQLHIAPSLMEALFAGIIFSLSLALGLAFGLGGKDAANRIIERARN